MPGPEVAYITVIPHTEENGLVFCKKCWAILGLLAKPHPVQEAPDDDCASTEEYSSGDDPDSECGDQA